MHQFLFYIGNYPVRAYGVILALAFILGVGLTVYLMRVEGKKEYTSVLLDMAPWLLVGGIVGARFWQVFFFDWAYYSHNPGEILAVWHGGLSIQGGVVGALLVGAFYLWRKKLSFWEFADFAAPGLIFAQGIGRSANLMNGDAFGDPTGGDFGILFPQGTLARQYFGDQPLWPAEIWEGQLDFLIFAILILLRMRKMPSGVQFAFYVIFYNLSRFFLEMLRGDSPRFLFDWTAAQWSSVVAVILGIGVLVWRIWKARKRPLMPEKLSSEELPSEEFSSQEPAN